MSAIASVGVNKAIPVREFWVVGNENKYGTPQAWSFYFITKLMNDTPATEAIAFANSRLSSFTDVVGPHHTEDAGWACVYIMRDTKQSHFGMALTPPTSFPGGAKYLFKK